MYIEDLSYVHIHYLLHKTVVVGKPTTANIDEPLTIHVMVGYLSVYTDWECENLTVADND